MKKILFIALLALPLAQGAAAHDFWIEPSTYRPAEGARLTATLRVGEHFQGDPVPRRSNRIEQFVVRTEAGEQSVNGIENRDPAGFVRMDGAGPAVLAYRGKPYPHEVSAKTFGKFLGEEGIRGVRYKDRVQRERFQRFAKAILNTPTPLVEKPFGWRFELVPDASLSRFQVLYEGKPLQDVQVVALSPSGKEMTARTDAEGRVQWQLATGVWLVKAVHLIAAPKDADYDWESLWGSVTFER
ncbi:MAG TPA: DUF4198 domain-containing protein [Thermoanaerobaculia bacterium]|nr:DUF4198 domain-containing protein [Thermoanaerobaculia bacterium]